MAEEQTNKFLDPTWLSEQLGEAVQSVKQESLSGAGGLSSAGMFRLVVELQQSETRSLVVKRTNPSDASKEMSVAMGLAREPLFYQNLAPKLTPGLVAAFVWGEGDMVTGVKTMILEDLSDCVQSGFFFGPGSPLNWGQDLDALTGGVNMTAREVTLMAFDSAAKLHAEFWKQKDLVQEDWLRGAAWVRGEGQAAYENGMEQSRKAWKSVKDELAAAAGGGDEGKVQWDDKLVACVDSAFAKASWESFHSDLSSLVPWTLVHGDFHPANMMVRKNTTQAEEEQPQLVMIDFEMVGIGSGPQELGQYLISHATPATREKLEHEAVEHYYNKLTSLNPAIKEEMSFEECLDEYVRGGVAKWM